MRVEDLWKNNRSIKIKTKTLGSGKPIKVSTPRGREGIMEEKISEIAVTTKITEGGKEKLLTRLIDYYANTNNSAVDKKLCREIIEGLLQEDEYVEIRRGYFYEETPIKGWYIFYPVGKSEIIGGKEEENRVRVDIGFFNPNNLDQEEREMAIINAVKNKEVFAVPSDFVDVISWEGVSVCPIISSLENEERNLSEKKERYLSITRIDEYLSYIELLGIEFSEEELKKGIISYSCKWPEDFLSRKEKFWIVDRIIEWFKLKLSESEIILEIAENYHPPYYGERCPIIKDIAERLLGIQRDAYERFISKVTVSLLGNEVETDWKGEKSPRIREEKMTLEKFEEILRFLIELHLIDEEKNIEMALKKILSDFVSSFKWPAYCENFKPPVYGVLTSIYKLLGMKEGFAKLTAFFKEEYSYKEKEFFEENLSQEKKAKSLLRKICLSAV